MVLKDIFRLYWKYIRFNVQTRLANDIVYKTPLRHKCGISDNSRDYTGVLHIW
jgi:hypothetical protein